MRLLDLGTNTTRKIKQNLWWGAGYNIVAIPLAAGVLAPVGILLQPRRGRGPHEPVHRHRRRQRDDPQKQMRRPRPAPCSVLVPVQQYAENVS